MRTTIRGRRVEVYPTPPRARWPHIVGFRRALYRGYGLRFDGYILRVGPVSAAILWGNDL